MSSSLTGRTLGNYKILEMLGAGGMATVYLGYQQSVDREVAVKVLPPHPGMDKQFIERFQIEGRTVAKLQHPHILPIYDYGIQDDILYFAMAYVKGGSLEDYVVDGPIELRRVEAILREVAGALDYAHRQNVIHRDIKPGNILLDSEGHALLADFGIAKLTEENSSLTGTSLVGTPAYMAPEQAQGLTIDSRADVYSLGVVVYQMLTGQVPFSDPTLMGVMLKVMQEPPPNLIDVRPDLPPSLAVVMDKVLTKDPDQRYQTATAFAEAFTEAIHNYQESLVAVRTAMPIDSGTQKVEQATVKQSTPKRQGNIPPSPPSENQTVVINQGVNPLVILGAVGLIAVAVVVVVLLVLSNDDDGGAPVTPAENPTQGVSVSENDETDQEIEVVINTPIPAPPSFGEASFGTNNEVGDSLSLRVSDIRPPPEGFLYVVWLTNTETEEKLNIGDLVVDSRGNGSLSYVDEAGRFLPVDFNHIAVSVEENMNPGDSPTGEIVYSGFVPIVVSEMLREFFIESEQGIGGEDGTPGGSLFAGLSEEADLAAQHAGLASRSPTIILAKQHAEHTVNILRGGAEDLDGNGDPQTFSPSELGVYYFLDLMDEDVLSVITSPEASVDLQENADLLRLCLLNTRNRALRTEELEIEILNGSSMEAIQDQLEESTRVMEELETGVDLDENGRIEGVENECGLAQFVNIGLLAGSLQLREGDVLGG